MLERMAAFPQILFLTSNDGTQQGRSGYDVLAEYFPPESARIVRRRREDARGPRARVWRKLVCRGAASSWCMPSSRELERMALAEIGRRRPEVVHHLWGNRDWGFLHRDLARLGIPLVLTLHNCPDNMAEVFPRPEVFAAVGAVVLMSAHQGPALEALGVPREKLQVVRHGIDVEYFAPPATPAPRGETFTVLSVGQTRRNFPVLRALVEAMQGDEGIEFRVISKPAFQARFAGLGKLRFESGLSNEALREAYQTARVQILTAEDATANNALLEGIACGLPVVGEAVGGIPEYCGRESALLVPPNDVAALRAGILRLRDDEAERRRRGEAARARALELRWEHSVEQLRALYTRLLAG
jgi:glycosyltransferase involved in cell wall biosynthesis